MKFPKISADKKGFTFIEIIMVVAILMMLAGLGFVFGIDFYKTYSIDTERNIVSSILQKARSRAQNNFNQSPHGVYFQSDNYYVIFQGNSFVARNVAYDQLVPKNQTISVSGISEIIFEQLSGDSSVAGDVILNNSRRISIISINNEGGINWQ